MKPKAGSETAEAVHGDAPSLTPEHATPATPRLSTENDPERSELEAFLDVLVEEMPPIPDGAEELTAAEKLSLTIARQLERRARWYRDLAKRLHLAIELAKNPPEF